MLKNPIIYIILTFAISACASTAPTDLPAQSVENYYQALMNKDVNRMISLSCSDWEENAQLDADSFQSANASLDQLICKQTGADGNTALVSCTGQIVMAYNGESQFLDLSARTYKVLNQDGNWLFCGYQ